MKHILTAIAILTLTATTIEAGSGYTSSAVKARLAYYAALQLRLASLSASGG